ncbi:fungal-specific transcription factor domain-containing protein [Truncatella angustata]|uniref:Fungal-specific transcription factor domain-containing protein n=1 Tax=Truncatella angustata TaxID=152316 RepID=A0A9P8UI77_9PEZI|nr:fungal-specific transcription factor domain-containing protein [Truncatella angustata]KAH6652662.1 fungal-specific transcription factor domain-containing protein [Truncatella angustata]
MSVAPLPGVHPVAMSRPQVGIERLPTRRMSNEPRESMNCKSCRKRKIKCNRLRPSCEACQVFQCACIYDAVPKKRGPKTDVLEALLKRVDGLEQKLKETKKSEDSPTAEEAPLSATTEDGASNATASETQEDVSVTAEPKAKRLALDTTRISDTVDESAVYSPTVVSEPSPGVQAEALLDTYFSRFHAKPYHILDESTVRQRLQLNQLPVYLVHAIYAVGARYTPHPSGYQSAVQLSEEYASQARKEIDTDEPSVDALQALLLLVTAFTAAGKGKKAYMLLTNAVGMAMALELHREVELNARITPVEREMRRRLFWTCYLLDRFMACGSKRPSLIGDKTILLRLPYWSPSPAALPIEGEFFQSDSNLQQLQGSGRKCQGSSGMLIDISRILGITNRYLAAGGVKGDSHFPWHSLSNLSKIRQHLDVWASGTDDVFSSVDSLFGQPDSTVLVLSKLIYHLIHCLVYRPFIPIDLAELAGSGQHQSWQIEATNMCFLHANAIAELVELGKQTATIEWPAFVGYCICTAGTVHIHGAHYNKIGTNEMSAFASSADFLSREMQQLSELRYAWASVQHQRETLQGIYNAHSELVKSVANNPMRHAPVFHLEDFFDRYANIGGPGGQTFTFDPANLSLSDVIVDFATDTYTGHDLYAPRHGIDAGAERPNLKRKSIAGTARKRPDMRNLAPIHRPGQLPPMHGLPTPVQHAFSAGQTPQIMLQSPRSLPSNGDRMAHHQVQSLHQDSEDAAAKAAVAAAAAAGFSLSPPQPAHQIPNMPATPFSPQYNFATLQGSTHFTNGRGGHDMNVGYDPMFGGVPTNAFSSPAAWHGDEDRRLPPVAPSPGAASHNGSAGTGPGEEKDPFLSLLEQLAENENAQGHGNDLDFFLNGAHI